LPGPLAGRRLWFVGIGGAGLSAYAKLARAWGAEVGGWDRVRTPYLAGLEQARVEIAPDPVVPDGWEAVVSSAYSGRVEGAPRAALLAELVAAQRSIVVAGAHGKTTTAAMIAFVLDRLGLDPAFLIGGDVPQLGGNARAGSGWLVVEGDESDRTIEALRPEIAVVLNVDLDHHTEFASRSEVEALFAGWLAHVPHVVRGEGLAPVELALAVPGAHNRSNAAAALAALELAGVPRGEAESALLQFRGVGRRFERVGEASGVVVVDDYAHNPAKLAAAIAAAREWHLGAHVPAHVSPGVVVLFQPHLYSRTVHSAHELGAAVAAADAAVVTDVYGAREEPVPGVTGKLVVDAALAVRPGMRIAWAPSLEDAVTIVRAWVRAGDLVLTVGAGDVDRAGPLLLEALA
jgi:UDP-N-acetylmuramate--alanine ligase